MILKNIFRKLFNRRIPPGAPYIPAPPTHSPFTDSPQADDGSYCEAEADVHQISNMPGLAFGSKTITQIFENDTKNISQKHSYVVGSGKMVNEISDIGGVCIVCQTQAIKQFQDGLITRQAAQLLSLYDNSSAATCNLCGLAGCSRHIRPTLLPDEQMYPICVNCQKELRRQTRNARIIKILGFLVTPFIEDE